MCVTLYIKVMVVPGVGLEGDGQVTMGEGGEATSGHGDVVHGVWGLCICNEEREEVPCPNAYIRIRVCPRCGLPS